MNINYTIEEVFDKYNKALIIFVWKILDIDEYEPAEDILADTFLKLCTSKKEFETEKHLGDWLYSVCKNSSRDYLKHKRRMKYHHDVILESSDLIHYIDGIMLKTEHTRKMLEMINEKLNESERRVVLLYLKDFPPKKIALILNISINTVRVLYKRAVGKLKFLKEELVEY